LTVPHSAFLAVNGLPSYQPPG